MALIESWFYQDLKEPVKVRYLDGIVFNDDVNANLIGVIVTDDGEPATLTGSCVGYCVLASGATVPVSGVINSNKAYIVLPELAYSIPGKINIIIKILTGSSSTTIAAIVSTVFGTGDVVTDPSTETVEEWTAQINATITALENCTVRYDESQSLTTAQKAQARTNIDATTTAVLVSGSDYKMIIP